MVFFDLFSGADEEVDDIKSLPMALREAYKNPHKILGIDRDTNDIALVRETFRKLIMAYITHFSGFSKPKFGEAEVNLAYHLIRKTVVGPATKLSKELNDLPHLDFRANDILPILRPMKSEFPCRREYRGFRMLAVGYMSYRSEPPYSLFPSIIYKFDVHYMLRRHTIELEYKHFKELNDHFEEELLTVPVLPFNSSTGRSYDLVGTELASYLMRVHVMLANLGLFSPRLLRFLGIDFEKVQTEEEGAIVAILDTQAKPPNSVWHIVNEEWLSKWRKFVMGRGPRMYYPPGPINNQRLKQELDEGNHDLELTKDYRCVNFNVWRFYELVHGGGPTISRIDEDIYGRLGLSYLQATIRVQTYMRIHLEKRRRRDLFIQFLSTCQTGKSVIIETALNKVREKAEKMMSDNQKERIARNLTIAGRFTQSMWRLKKKYVLESSLEVKKQDQEIFRKVKNVAKDVPHATAEGRVIDDMHPIVHIGNVNIYTRKLVDTEEGIPFTIARKPGTQDAIISSAQDPSIFIPKSKLLSINSFPTNILDYEEIRQRLVEASFPVELELEKPIRRDLVPKLDDLIAMTDPILQFNTFKLVLQSGIYLIKHNSGNSNSHLSRVWISDKSFYYTSRYEPTKKEDDLWNSFFLYKLKFILNGPGQSETITQRKLDPSCCFEIITDDRGLVFQLPTPTELRRMVREEKALRKAQEAKDAARKREGRVEGRKSIVQEDLSSDDEFLNVTESSGHSFFIGSTKTSKSDDDKELEAYQQAVLREHLKKKRVSLFDSFYVSTRKGLSTATGKTPHNKKATVVTDSPHKKKCAFIVHGLIKLVEEVRGSQTFVDREGMPIRRVKPKISLKKYDGHK